MHADFGDEQNSPDEPQTVPGTSAGRRTQKSRQRDGRQKASKFKTKRGRGARASGTKGETGAGDPGLGNRGTKTGESIAKYVESVHGRSEGRSTNPGRRG